VPSGHAPKEVLEAALGAAADSLEHAEVDGGHVRPITPDALKLVSLAVVGEAYAAHAVRLAALLKARIIDLTCHVKLLL
jgi:hypothetical protein